MGAMEVMGALQQESFKGMKKLDALPVGDKDSMLDFLTSSLSLSV
jgi:hypothetical protein